MARETLSYRTPTVEDLPALEEFRLELLEEDGSFDGCFSLKRLGATEAFLESCRLWQTEGVKGSRGTVLLAYTTDRRLVGSVQIHFCPNTTMLQYTGLVGYSVRPSERRKGYATQMLKKALVHLASYGFQEVLVSVLPENEGSRHNILKCGGRYFDRVLLPNGGGVLLDRYKIPVQYAQNTAI